MTPNEQTELLALFKESFEDHVITRKERKGLNQKLKELTLTDQEKNIVRSKVFEIGRATTNINNFELTLIWLEEVAKLLIKSHDVKETIHNGAFFSPGGECRNAIISFIKSARQNLKICVFTISDDPISKEIVAAHKRGVTVQLITDDDKQFDRGSDIGYLKSQGIEVHCDESTAHMHHKFAIADKKSILTGSYNWTRSAATSNQENILISDNKATISSFTNEFARLWKQFS